jgi:hypothetical protein
MIDRGADNWNWGLEGACQGGHPGLAQLMIDKGANDWNYGLEGACQMGHLILVQLMISKGADSCGNCQGSKHEFPATKNEI